MMATVADYSKRSSLQILLRSLLPSVTSLMVSFSIAAVIVGIHALSIDLNAQTSLPKALGPGGVSSYTKAVTQPLHRVLNNGLLNSVLTILLWAVIGLVVYELLERAVITYQRLHQTNREVYVVKKGLAVFHPLRRSLLVALLWRLFISVLVVALTIVAQPLVRQLFANDVSMFRESTLNIIRLAAGNLLGWMLLEHLYLILLRWYLSRTRVFGEILY